MTNGTGRQMLLLQGSTVSRETVNKSEYENCCFTFQRQFSLTRPVCSAGITISSALQTQTSQSHQIDITSITSITISSDPHHKHHNQHMHHKHHNHMHHNLIRSTSQPTHASQASQSHTSQSHQIHITTNTRITSITISSMLQTQTPPSCQIHNTSSITSSPPQKPMHHNLTNHKKYNVINLQLQRPQSHQCHNIDIT